MSAKDRYSHTPDTRYPASTRASSSSVIPDTGYVRLKQILQVIPVGKTTWWEGVKSGKFPPSYKLGSRTTVWKVTDIHQLIADIAGGEW